MEFLNSASGRTCMFTGVHHWSWSGLNMFVYLADGVTADTFNDAFNVGDTLRVRQTADWDRPVKRLFKNKNSNAPAYLNRSVTSSTPGVLSHGNQYLHHVMLTYGALAMSRFHISTGLKTIWH